MRAIVLFFLISQIFLVSVPNIVFAKDSQKIQVLTTIKPITMLVYAITKDNAVVQQLIPDFTSVHDYSLKPSDLKKIKHSKVIFRIDDHMESHLNSVFDLLPDSIPLISLAENENILLLPVFGRDQGEKDHGHDHGNTDLHIWTSPQNAIVMARIITTTLGNIDPNNAAVYENNFKQLNKKINSTAEAINIELISVKNKEYVVFHNSWQYFKKSFGLKSPITVAVHESISPGIKSIRDIRKKIQQIKPSCLFGDPYVNKSRIKTITEGFNINIAIIDVLASGSTIDEDAYINWLQSMKQKIIGCL